MSDKRTQVDYSHTSIFDLDHTLCKVNTSFRFGIHLLYKGVLPVYKMPFLFFCYMAHKMGVMSISLLHKEACHYFFYGKSIKDLGVYVDNFLNSNLLKMLNPSVLERFNDAKSRGHYTVLLSSSPDFLVREIAARLEFNEWAATEYSLLEGQTIGDVGLLMEGEQKANYVRGLMSRLEISKEGITAYSDSYLDVPFLESVGKPVAVNPDKKLRKLSLANGWEVI